MGEREEEDAIGWWPTMTTYFNVVMLMFFGYPREIIYQAFYAPKSTPGYASLINGWQDFFNRRMYYRVRDVCCRPIASCPGTVLEVVERYSDDYNVSFKETGKTRSCLNLGSYNYLGFADTGSPFLQEVVDSFEEFPVSTCSTMTDAGTTELHRELEDTVADFLGKEAAMVIGMGFGTNSTGIPGLVGRDGLIVSDSLNHASIVIGARNSGAKVRVFKHGDMDDLEAVIRTAIIEGRGAPGRKWVPWSKILIIAEGVYSMEGEICELAKIVAIKKKYNCFLFVDEAHSIGGIGKTGRGVCEYRNVNPADVDVLMGTFTKSFGAVGGYIAGSRQVIDFMRHEVAGSVYSPSISPACCRQILCALRVLTGRDGTDLGRRKLIALRENANYVRKAMIDLGCIVLGDYDSPVVPIIVCNPSKVAAFSRMALEKNLALVATGYPASGLLLARVRLCLSAGHTREQLEDAVEKMKDIARRVHVLYKAKWIG